MPRHIPYIILSALLLFCTLQGVGQASMPDYVCVGTTKTYQVNPTNPPGSTYTWKIDGVTQSSTTNQLTVTWNTVGIFLITVQERSADGCDGEIQSGLVYVTDVTVTLDKVDPTCAVSTGT